MSYFSLSRTFIFFSLFILILFSEQTEAQNIIQTQKIAPLTRKAGAHFGGDVSIEGNYALIGAFDESFGIDTPNAGAVYAYRFLNGKWIQTQKITESDPRTKYNRQLGWDIDISGNFAILATEKNSQSFGNAYIYERDTQGHWTLVKKFFDFEQSRNIICSGVAINGNTAVITGDSMRIFERQINGNWVHVQSFDEGFYGHSVTMDGEYIVTGDPGNNYDYKEGYYKEYAGAIYVYKKNNLGNWGRISKITADDRQSYNYFGTSVDISGNNIVVGAPDAYNLDTKAGAIYVFKIDSVGKWIQTNKFIVGGGGGYKYLGSAVSISGNLIVAGAPAGSSYGKIYTYQSDSQGKWSKGISMSSNDIDGNDLFGCSIDIDNNKILVGATDECEDELLGNYKLNAGSAYNFDVTNLNQVNQNILLNFKIFPNPIQSFFEIKSSVVIDNIQLFDSWGRFLDEFICSSINLKINLSEYSNGIYWLRIKTKDNDIFIKQLVKQ